MSKHTYTRCFWPLSFITCVANFTCLQSGDSSSPLAVVLGTPLKGEDGQLIGVSDVKESLDLFGAMVSQ